MTLLTDVTIIAETEFQQRVSGLIGQPFSKAGASYGDELRLSFGLSSQRPERWQLGVRTSRWVLLDDPGMVARDGDGPDGLVGFGALDGARVTAVDATRADRTLVLAFDSGHRFVLLPNRPHRSKGDLDLWELFSPHGWWLAVRRDGSIELVPNEMPLSERPQRRSAA